jgi:hypothetical protein
MLKYIDEKNSNLARDENTGEVIEATTVIIPIGSKIQTPEQQKTAREWHKKQTKQLICRKMQDELGYFYFVMREHEFGKLSAESSARLVYLCTFLDYDNKFMITNHRIMKKSDLKEILFVSARTALNFWKEVENTYIVDLGKDGLRLNNPNIIRGCITSSEKIYKKFYIDGIRRVYRACPISKHKYLGYIFKLLPYVNTEYNVICKNPDEEIWKEIMPLTATEICRLIGYDETHVNRLTQLYKKLTFENQGEAEYFLSLIYNQSGLHSLRAFINPHVLYSGSNYERVKVVGELAVK